VTPRQLIGHSSGLSELAFDDVHASAPDLETAVRSMCAALPSSPPGKRFQYIDSDYQALGLIMEKATGKPYAVILDERVFAPLGMKSSSGAPQPFPPIGSTSFFALPLSRPATSSSFGGPSGYVVTTAADAGQYLAFLLGPEKFTRGPLPSRSVAALFEAAVPGAPYGYGFFLGEEAGSRAAYHDGSLDGFSSRVVLWPDRNSGIAVLGAQSSLLQSLFALPAMTSGARRIMQEGSSPRPFPLGRLYILLAVVAVVGILALLLQTGGALRWTKGVRDKAEAKGTRGPIRFAILRCWAGIALRGGIVAFFPIAVGLAFGKAVSWKILMQLEPGLAAWCMIVCVLGALRNAARLAWIRGPAGFHRSR
jgi:CubicO group peptidase (beta-lactamase class C family)